MTEKITSAEFKALTVKGKKVNFNSPKAKNELAKVHVGTFSKNKYSVRVGIDPDVHKSGVAYMSEYEKLQLYTYKYFELFDFLKALKDSYDLSEIIVVIEAGWLNEKSNFHSFKGRTNAGGERIAKNVGANHEAGRKIVEMCEYLGLHYNLIRPTKAKTKPAIFEKLTGLNVKNQEKIDAAMLII